MLLFCFELSIEIVSQWMIQLHKDGEDNKVQLRKGDGGLQGLLKVEKIHAVHSFWVNGCKFKSYHWFTSKTKEEE